MDYIDVTGKFSTNNAEINGILSDIAYVDSFKRSDGSYAHMFKCTFKDGFQTPVLTDSFGHSREKEILIVNT